MVFGGQKRDEILYDGVVLLTMRGLRPQFRLVHRRMKGIILGISSIEVEGQRACNHEPVSGAISGSWGVMSEVVTDVLDPLSYNRETISSLGYTSYVEIRERSEPLERRMKRRVQYPQPVTSC